jgi:TM2 domain-containing membrane protein YozV
MATEETPQTEAEVKPAAPKKLGIYLVLCFFLGMFGVHSFYAGKILKGIAQVFFTITGSGAAVTAIWCLFDFLKAVFKKEVPQKKK